MRTRLTILAALTLAALLAPTAAAALATHSPGPGHHGSGGTGSGEDHGSSGSGSGDDHGSDDEHAVTAAPAAAPPVGSVANRQAGQRRLSTPPLPITPTPSAAADPAAASASAAADPASAVTPGSAVVIVAVLVLAAMVAAGFRARARLGRLG